jgi:PadR family transcriptional regulator, regulatory protein AphA
MELSATGKVILGMLAASPRTGYEIKQLVDKSARFFWAASYGQIYPELKKLEKEGLITGDDSSQGARQRTTFKLTAEGRRAAREWMAKPPEVLETRDEGLLKLFFAGAVEPARTAEIARERAAASREMAAQLSSIAEQIDENGHPGEGPDALPDEGSLSVLRFGIEASEWEAEWFERAAEHLENQAGSKSGGR